MQILSVHNNYLIRGGEDESRAAEEQLLRETGHQVDVYEEHNERIAELGATQTAIRTIWSQESYHLVKQQLQKSAYDLVHVQNFFPLISPSVYYAAHSQNVPVIQTLRNYRLLCPNGLFFRDGRVCEDCLGKFIPASGIQHNCYRQNQAATLTTAMMLMFHRLIGTWMHQVNLFITLSEFARHKFITAGFPAEKIVVKPNFVDPDPGMGGGNGGYALYVGRLSVEKGLDTLLQAWEHLKFPIPLKIVGDGPLSSLVVAATQRSDYIQWLGRKPLPEAYDLIGEATMLIFPSKWYETFGRVAVEAFAKGTPVIAANLGAIAELVQDQYTGLHFQPGNAADLASKVEILLSQPQRYIQRMRRAAREQYQRKYTAKQNYHQLMEIYQEVILSQKLSC